VYITEKEVPEGKVVYATMAVRDIENDSIFVGNVIFGADVVEQDPPSDELIMLADTALAVCQGHTEIIKTLASMGYMPIIEDDDDCLVDIAVPDDLSGLE
jgi:hypothetical protein